MSVPIAFNSQLFFDVVNWISREVGRKKLNIVQDAVKTTIAVIVVHLVQNVWDALTKSCMIEPHWAEI